MDILPVNSIASGYAQANCVIQLSPVEQLHSLRDRRKQELQDIEAAIAALEKAPEVANALHLIGKALRY